MTTKALQILVFTIFTGITTFAQSNFWVSCPSELKLTGRINYFFVARETYITYNPSGSDLKVIMNMWKLEAQNNAPIPGIDIEFNPQSADTNSFIFEGDIPEDKLRPKKDLNDTYTFAITGIVKYREVSYPTQIICSYGARMLRNTAQIALNIDIELLKMDQPMYIPRIKEYIDNLRIEIVDGTVNMVQD